MKPNIPAGFKARVEAVVLMHRKRTNKFKMPIGGWGDIKPMMDRIMQELQDEAGSYHENENEKSSIIQSAVKRIAFYYKICLLSLSPYIERILSFEANSLIQAT